MKLTRYTPVREVERAPLGMYGLTPLRELERLDDIFTTIFGDMQPKWFGGEGEVDTWRPAVDIIENDTDFVLKAELPEIDPKEVHVKIEGDLLTISGERKVDKEVKEDQFRRTERYYGAFTRSFCLPENVDRDKIKASFKEGVMKLELPKKEVVKPHEIKVEAA